ncbi:hypothetical protein RFI_30782, partial [Reticulomyxa filosa]
MSEVLIIQNLIVVNSFVLYQKIKQFVYGMLIITNKSIIRCKLDYVYCVKFSLYHNHNNHQNIICFSSQNNSIRFWDFEHNQQLQSFKQHTNCAGAIKFSPFSGGRYLCFGSYDNKIRLCDVETCKTLHVFNGHTQCVWCVNISPLQNNNNSNNESNNIGVIGGNGYTICSGSFDNTIRICDIETTKKLTLFKGHTDYVKSVKYGSNALANTILSGSGDTSVCLLDIPSGQQIQVFNRHSEIINNAEYSPF